MKKIAFANAVNAVLNCMCSVVFNLIELSENTHYFNNFGNISMSVMYFWHIAAFLQSLSILKEITVSNNFIT